jgi:PiT family inorganic phosphate transporter
VAGNIVAAWVLTLPAAAAMGALTYGVTRIFGTGAAGPVIVSVLILAGGALLFAKRAQQARTTATTAAEA